MLDILSDYEVQKLTGSVCNDKEAYTPSSEEELEKTRHWYHTRNEQENRLDLAIVDKKTNKVVGEVVFNEYDDRIPLNFIKLDFMYSALIHAANMFT